MRAEQPSEHHIELGRRYVASHLDQWLRPNVGDRSKEVEVMRRQSDRDRPIILQRIHFVWKLAEHASKVF
jgi:hypothetical protein